MDENGKLPAWPVVADNGAAYASAFRGLTKREAFAMAAMQGMARRVTSLFDHEVAGDAVRLADALLAELAKEPA